MDFEKYTDRARGFVQSAQSAGAARGPPAIHPRTYAEGPARRPGRAGGRPDRPLRRQFPPGAAGGRGRACQDAEGLRRRRPARSISRRRTARVFDNAAEGRRKGRRQLSSPSSGCCWRWRWRRTARPARYWPRPASLPQNLNAAINALRKGRTADNASAENAYDALKKYARDLTQAAQATASSIR